MSDIDARDFGRLEAQVEVLQGQVSQLSNDVKALLELANQSKGGFWMGMVIASALSGVVSFFAARWISKLTRRKLMMYGKSSKMPKKDGKKGVPIAIMVAVGKPKAMPMRGQRTATNMMKKSGRGK